MKNPDIVIPIEEYNFLADYDDHFFSEQYPTMWKNVCLYVEMKHWAEIEKEARETKLLEISLLQAKNDWEWDKWNFDVTKYINGFASSKKKELAMRMMKKQIKEIKKIEFNGDTYILTDEEVKEIEEEIKRKVKDKYITVIDKNGIYAKIDRTKRKTVFQYKEWLRYNINIAMSSKYHRHLTEREYVIISQCAEVGLHYKWIAELFWADERFMNTTCKRLWYDNVFVTPQKLMKTLPRVKVLDTSGFFVIEKDNHLIKLKSN